MSSTVTTIRVVDDNCGIPLSVSMTYNNKWKIVHKHTMKYISTKWERAKKNGLLCWSRVDGLIIIDFHAVHSLSLPCQYNLIVWFLCHESSKFHKFPTNWLEKWICFSKIPIMWEYFAYICLLEDSIQIVSLFPACSPVVEHNLHQNVFQISAVKWMVYIRWLFVFI